MKPNFNDMFELVDRLEHIVYCFKIDLDPRNDQEEFLRYMKSQVAEVLNLEIPK